MNEEAGGPPSHPAAPVTAAKPRATWRRALGLVRSNIAATMLPLAVIQVPLGIIGAAAYFYLYHQIYPSADFESFSRFDDSPNGLILALVAIVLVVALGVLATGLDGNLRDVASHL